MSRIWKFLSRPKIAIPLLLMAGFLAAALALSNIGLVFDRIGAIPLRLLALTVFLAALYLVFKGLQFYFFLRDLGLRPSWPDLVLAYAVGELTLALPMGIYAQNYVLLRLQGSNPSRSAAATTVMLLLEIAALFLVLAVVGVPGWPWVQPLAIASFLGLGGFVALVTRWEELRRFIARRLLGFGLSPRPYLHFVRSLDLLTSGYSMLRHGWLSALYLTALFAAFDVVAHGVGVPLGLRDSVSIYAFSLTAALLLGSLTTQVGLTEVAGMGAAHALGFDYTEGLAMLPGFRLVWTACIWLLCLPLVIALKGQLDHDRG